MSALDVRWSSARGTETEREDDTDDARATLTTTGPTGSRPERDEDTRWRRRDRDGRGEWRTREIWKKGEWGVRYAVR